MYTRMSEALVVLKRTMSLPNPTILLEMHNENILKALKRYQFVDVLWENKLGMKGKF